MMLPADTMIPSDGTGDPSGVAFQAKKFGTFWTSGAFVSAFDTLGKLLQVKVDELNYLQRHFRVDGTGPSRKAAVNNTGPCSSSR